MTRKRKSKRELVTAVEEIAESRAGEVQIDFEDYFVFYHVCLIRDGAVNENMADEGLQRAFFGRPVLTPENAVDHWIRLVSRIWDGEEDPPIEADELRDRVTTFLADHPEVHPSTSGGDR